MNSLEYYDTTWMKMAHRGAKGALWWEEVGWKRCRVRVDEKKIVREKRKKVVGNGTFDKIR